MRKLKLTDLPIELLKICLNQLSLRELQRLLFQSKNHLISDVTLELLRSKFTEFLAEIKSCHYKLILEICFPSDYKKTYKTSLNFFEFRTPKSPKKTLYANFNSEHEATNRKSKIPNHVPFNELFQDQTQNHEPVTILINLSLYNLNSRCKKKRYLNPPILCGTNWRGAIHEISIFEYLENFDLDHLTDCQSQSTHLDSNTLSDQILTLGSLPDHGLEINLEFSNSHIKFIDLGLDCLQLFEKLQK